MKKPSYQPMLKKLPVNKASSQLFTVTFFKLMVTRG